MHMSVIRSFTVVKYHRHSGGNKEEKKEKKWKILFYKQIEGIEQE
jgi:hypothetical protein